MKNHDQADAARTDGCAGPKPYQPPAVTYLGSLADLTGQAPKTVGAADGATFLGLDIGSI